MEEQEDATAFTTGFEKKAGIPRWETGIFRWPRELLAEAKEGTGPLLAEFVGATAAGLPLAFDDRGRRGMQKS